MLKYVNTGIVFQEIPDEVTLAINISNCPCHCPGCHSKFLWEDVGAPLTTEVLDEFIAKFGSNITCICFMGGDSDPSYLSQLAAYIHAKYPHYRVAWYSGSLKCKTTNQRLYKLDAAGDMQDITYRFWSR